MGVVEWLCTSLTELLVTLHYLDSERTSLTELLVTLHYLDSEPI